MFESIAYAVEYTDGDGIVNGREPHVADLLQVMPTLADWCGEIASDITLEDAVELPYRGHNVLDLEEEDIIWTVRSVYLLRVLCNCQ